MISSIYGERSKIPLVNDKYVIIGLTILMAVVSLPKYRLFHEDS